MNDAIGFDVHSFVAEAADAMRSSPDAAANANVPEPERRLRLSEWTMASYAGEPEPLRWLVRGSLPLGVPVLVAASGGAGKSFLALELAYRIARGPVPFGEREPPDVFSGQVVEHGTAVMLTAEDSKASVHRRLLAIDGERGLLPTLGDRLRVAPLPDAGGPMPLVVPDGRGGIATSPAFDHLLEELRGIEDLRLVVVDPLQAFTTSDVNADPAAGQAFAGALARLAAETGATVMALHHMRKSGAKSETPKTAQDAREDIRGTTAIVDGMRCAYALWPASDDAAKRACTELGIAHEPNRVFLGAVVKANEPTDNSVRTLVRAHSGLLVDRTDRLKAVADLPENILATVVDIVRRQAELGTPLTRSGGNSLFKRQEHLPPDMRAMPRAKVDEVITHLLAEGRIVGIAKNGGSQLDVPGGKLAGGSVPE